LLCDYHSGGLPREVVSRVESGRFASSAEVLELYARSLVACQVLPEAALPPTVSALGNLWKSASRGGQLFLPPSDIRAAVQAGAGSVGGAGAAAASSALLGGGGSGGGGSGGGSAYFGPAGMPMGTRANPVIVESHERVSFMGMLMKVMPLAVLAYFAYSAMSGSKGMTFNPLGGPDITDEVSSIPDTRFDDVKGCDEAKAELQDVVNFLRDPARYSRLGAKVPAGVLLTGPPGTGKTLLARAVAGEAGCKFYSKSASEFEEMLVGLGARRVRDLFASARKNSPSIIFIDEIDALGGKRRMIGSGNERQTLNQLLACMDGFSKNSGVIVIAATNAPEILDAALTRPGRFDSSVDVPLPDVKGRREIIELYLSRVVCDEGVSAELLAKATPGFSGAQLEALINSAALMAAARGSDSIEGSDVEEARDKLIMGPSKLSRVKNAEAQRLTAFHEGGHTLVSMLTPGTSPLHKVTILPRGQSGGATFMLPNDTALRTKASILAEIDVSMGGRAAEEIVYGVDGITSGASGDMEGASRLARAYCTAFAMSEVGMASFAPPGSSGGGGWTASPDRHAMLDLEVEKILKASYARVKALLEKNRLSLDRLAAALVRPPSKGAGTFFFHLPPPPPPHICTRSQSITHPPLVLCAD
jgi:ATP-dependent metalloprotease